MGFKLPERTLTLQFEGTAWEGAEIKMRLDLPLSSFIDAQRLQAAGDIEGIANFVAGLLMSWNLDNDDGKPKPPTYEGVMSLPATLLNDLITLWVQGQVEPPTPLKQGSSNGVT